MNLDHARVDQGPGDVAHEFNVISYTVFTDGKIEISQFAVEVIADFLHCLKADVAGVV